MELLSNIKLSSKFSFPQLLKLKPFMHQDSLLREDGTEKEDEEFEYRLVGVVIHRGNANFGHYTSLINMNRTDPNRPEKKDDEWMEFDDSKIYSFNMKNFEDECFGSKVKFDYSSANYFGMESNISKSAYILVFDKVRKSQLRLAFNEQNLDQFDKVVGVIKGKQFTFENGVLETDFYNLEPYIPERYKKGID